MSETTRIGFLGAGKMATALAQGWIAAGLFFSWYLYQFKPALALEAVKLAGYVSIGLGVFSFFLPHTPPAPRKPRPSPPPPRAASR